jgi:putative membrane protein
VPAIVVREILVRRSPLQPGKWLSFIVLSVCLAISAAYELLEFCSALILGQGADRFLGTQGDPWDTQWDMTTALIGAIVSLVVLSRWHQRQIWALERRQRAR